MAQLILATGIIASLFFFASIFFQIRRMPKFNYKSGSVSDLGSNAKTRSAYITTIIIYSGLQLFSFGWILQQLHLFQPITIIPVGISALLIVFACQFRSDRLVHFIPSTLSFVIAIVSLFALTFTLISTHRVLGGYVATISLGLLSAILLFILKRLSIFKLELIILCSFALWNLISAVYLLGLIGV